MSAARMQMARGKVAARRTSWLKRQRDAEAADSGDVIGTLASLRLGEPAETNDGWQ